MSSSRSDDQRPRRVDLGFGGLRARVGDHIGHFYQTREECSKLLVPFLQAGLEAHEKCICLLPPGPQAEGLEDALRSAGVDVAQATASGQLAIEHGKSSPEEMQCALRDALADVPVKYPLLRWGADMTWSLSKLPTTESLMEWESHCNTVENPPAVFLCQYDLGGFQGTVVMDALRTHPICIVNNVIHQNPYYLEPQVFLDDLHEQAAVSPER